MLAALVYRLSFAGVLQYQITQLSTTTSNTVHHEAKKFHCYKMLTCQYLLTISAQSTSM